MSFLATLLGGLAEAAYNELPALAGKVGVSEQELLAVKLLDIKAISQDLGETAAVTFLQANDPVLGPIAQKVVDAVNGDEADAVTVVMGLLAQGAIPLSGAAGAVVEGVAAVAEGAVGG
jgi:hypothetical protein